MHEMIHGQLAVSRTAELIEAAGAGRAAREARSQRPRRRLRALLHRDAPVITAPVPAQVRRPALP